MTCTANVILASYNTVDQTTLYTVELRYWRAIHAELMTHRQFSRNAGSSRAIPIKKVLAQVWSDPAGPEHWGLNQPGMQASAELPALGRRLAKLVWRTAGKAACVFAWSLMKLGLHKQICNRVLEPWQYINVLVSATDWQNFFDLRAHPDAQPEIQTLAVAIAKAMKEANVYPLLPGEWHIPYILEEEFDLPLLTKLKLSTARCARVSYAPFDGNASVQKEIERHDLLVSSEPMHASPAEHQARASAGRHANFSGFRQYRHFLETGSSL